MKKGQDPITGSNPLTPGQVTPLAFDVVLKIQNENALAGFLLLCHAFTYEDDANVREEMLEAVEKQVTPMLREVGDAVKAVKRRRLAELEGSAK